MNFDFAIGNGAVGDHGAAPCLRQQCKEMNHEEERASGSVCIHPGILELVGPDGQQRVAPLRAPARSAQPIAHQGVLPVDSQPLAFTSAILLPGALCLTRGFYFQRCDVAWPLGLGKRAETFPKKGSIPSHDAAFTAPPRTTTRMQPGNYGNGWRNFYAVSNAERTSHGCPVGYRDNTGCCAGVRYTVLSTPFARALLTKALAGTRWSAMTAPSYCRSRRACGGPVPALAGSLLQP